MTKIADTVFKEVVNKGDLAVASLTSSDRVPVYDDSAGTWKMVPIDDFASDVETGDATAAEKNLLDVSAQTETLLVAGAVSVTKRLTNLSADSGAYAITLAAPDASMLGQVKIIQMTVAGNDITMALTNVQGGSAANTATFNAVNETLTLIAGANKWTVLNETGVTLS